MYDKLNALTWCNTLISTLISQSIGPLMHIQALFADVTELAISEYWSSSHIPVPRKKEAGEMDDGCMRIKLSYVTENC
jgi:hypothetical protein